MVKLSFGITMKQIADGSAWSVENELEQGSGAFSSQRAFIASYCKTQLHGSHDIVF